MLNYIVDMLRDERGNVAILFSFVLVPVLVLAGGVIDYNRAINKSVELQVAMDIAVLAAIAKPLDDRKTTATQFFDVHVNASDGATVSTPNFTNIADNKLNGEVSADVPTLFLGLVGMDKLTVRVSSAAMARGSDGKVPCVIVLDKSKWYAFRLKSSSNIDGNVVDRGCELHSHSGRDDSSVGFESVSEVEFQRVCTKGGVKSPILNIEEDCAVSRDPYAGKQPAVGVGGCDFNNKTFTAREMPMGPGVYCGDTTLPDSIEMAMLRPGLYIFKGGEFAIEAKNVIGNGVTFYFADDDATLSMTSINSITLSAPEDGEYKDWLIFHRYDAEGNTINIDSVNNVDWKGIIHTPYWDYRIDSASKWETQMNLIANSVEIDSISNWTLTPHDLTELLITPILIK